MAATDSLEVLKEQYKIAIELYRHEDDLNWRKLNHLLYVNAGLYAVIGFIIENGTVSRPFAISPRFLVATVCIIGLIVSSAFGIALWYGIKYMHSRKNTVAVIEQLLIECGGISVVSVAPENQTEARFLETSPTTWMLKLVPILLSVIWFIILVVLR